MGLEKNRQLFFKMRNNCSILVRAHAYKHYPERGFTAQEIINLVRNGIGRFVDNNSDMAIDGSYCFLTKDDRDNECKLVLLIEELDIEGKGGLLICQNRCRVGFS